MKNMNYVIIAILCSQIACGITEPATLGKTHFIVGYTGQDEHKQVAPRLQERADIPFGLAHGNQIKSAYFSPADPIAQVLDYLVAQEKKRIRVAMFTFTDRKFARALVAARNRGVHVELITDASNVYGKYSKMELLHAGNVHVFTYNPQRDSCPIAGIMHNKFLLFDENVLGKQLVWTGSLNFTRSAHCANRENVLILDDAVIIEKFVKQFEQLKLCCDHYQKPIAVAKR